MDINKKYEQLAAKMGHDFTNKALLELALTHCSRAPCNNERLEFLGDAVLACIIASWGYRLQPELAEGELSEMKSQLVSKQQLSEVAVVLGLADHLILGVAEQKARVVSTAMLADALEALIGAIYLDAGLAKCEACVLNWYRPWLDAMQREPVKKPYKTQLQEHLQADNLPLPRYRVVGAKGKEHAKIFEIECSVVGLDITSIGQGKSKREAEQIAARKILQLLASSAGEQV